MSKEPFEAMPDVMDAKQLAEALQISKAGAYNLLSSPDGEVSLDFKGKMPGRGAYLCPNGECLKKAMKSKALERAFSTQIPAEIYDALEKQMEANQ